MTLRPIDYLSWAIEAYPKARWDLGTSGVEPVGPAELGVPDDLGDAGATSRFAERVAARYGVPVGDVVPALGASGALSVVARALLAPGDEVAVEAPAYEPIYRVVEGCGATLTRFARVPEEGYTLDPARVLAVVTPRTRAVLVTNPHNPSGVHVGDGEVAALASALEARGVELVVDEVYREICAPAATARRLGANVCAVSSLTKCFGLGWARAGWALLRPELAEQVRIATLHTCGVLPTTVGALGARGLASIERLAARVRERSVGKRAAVDAFLSRHASELVWVPPAPEMQFGFVQDRRGRDLGPVLAEALERDGVVVAPGTFFDQASAFRMSWTLPAGKLEEALARLARSLGLQGS